MSGWIEGCWAGELEDGLVHLACETMILGRPVLGGSMPRTFRALALMSLTLTSLVLCRFPLFDEEERLETSPSVKESGSSIAYLESKS